MALTPADKQRRYRQKLKENALKNAEAKRKHLARYHASKKLVKDMTEREHRSAKRKWRIANKKRRESRKAAQAILIETPVSTPRSGFPISPRSRGRRNVRRDRSALYRQNMKLLEQINKLTKKCNKYKKRYQRQKASKSKTGDDKKYTALSNAIRDRYSRIRSVKESRAIREIFQGDSIQSCRMKGTILQETLGIQRLKQSQTAPKQAILAKKIKIFYDRDDVTRATAGKRETVTCKKKKVQKRYLLDTMKNLHISSVSNQYEIDLIEKENVHPSKISLGVYVIVKVNSDKDKSYSYLGVAQSDVDEEGEIKIMFFKSVDDSGKRFKVMEKDVSYEPYESILEICSSEA